jgi:predicted nucleic acid-binding protein
VTASPDPVRVFVDTNVIIECLYSPWSLSRAVIILARAGLFRLVLSPYVEDEVDGVLLNRFAKDSQTGSKLIDDYALMINLLKPERTERITQEEFNAHLASIRHLHDVPVLVTAIKAKPDWLITSNTEHFNEEVAMKTGLRIATPQEFLRQFKIHP